MEVESGTGGSEHAIEFVNLLKEKINPGQPENEWGRLCAGALALRIGRHVTERRVCV